MKNSKKIKNVGKKEETAFKEDDVLLSIMKSYPLIRTETEVFIEISRFGAKSIVPINSDGFRKFIKSVYKEETGDFPSDRTLRNCIEFMDNLAYKNEIVEINYRIAMVDNSIIYDLGNGNYVNINENGWKIDDNTRCLFMRNSDQKIQVMPKKCNNGLDLLDKYLNISDDEKLLLKIYIVSCFNPSITNPSLNINGTNGSGKSTLSRIIKRIIDPSSNELEMLPDNTNDLRIRLKTSYYTAFDNLSSITSRQSDFLCKAITGVSQSTRRLYTNSEQENYRLKSIMCFNGITNFVKKADLIERMLFINTKLIKGNTRLDDIEIEKSFENDLPYIMGGIFDVLSKALAIRKNVKIKKVDRLAAFHKFSYAIAEAMNGKGEEFNRIFSENSKEKMDVTCENNILVQLIIEFLKEQSGKWNSSMSFLYKTLKNYMLEKIEDDDIDGYSKLVFPNGANHLSRNFRAYESTLAKKGVFFTIKKNGEGNSEINIETNWIIRTPIKFNRTPIFNDKKKEKEYYNEMLIERALNAREKEKKEW